MFEPDTPAKQRARAKYLEKIAQGDEVVTLGMFFAETELLVPVDVFAKTNRDVAAGQTEQNSHD